MTITSSCKKMMAFVMAIALVLSVLFIPGKVASAAEGDTPSVKVLGATIRLAADDNNGTQSMRIGIQVDNANKANACAIQLTVNGVTYTVATKASKGDLVQDKMHSKDVENNSVVYAVVLTNIPESAYYSTIRIIGKAWDANDVEYDSAPAEKNLIGVVDTIKSKYPGLNICILDGSLYKDAGTSKLTAADLEGYTDDPDPSVTGNPVATPAPTREPVGADEWAVPIERINENAQGQIFYAEPDPNHQACARTYDRYADELLITNETTDANADGLTVNLPAEEVAKRYTKVTVNYEYVGEGDGLFGFKYRKSDGSEYFNFNDNQFSRSETSKVIDINSGYVPVEKFYIITFATGISIRIKSIIFSNPKPDYSGAVDLASFTGANGGVTYSNGQLTIDDPGAADRNTTELLFDLPNGGTIDNGERVSIVVSGSVTGSNFGGFRARIADSNNDGVSSWGTTYTAVTSRQFLEVFTVTATSASATKVAIKSANYNGPLITDLTIDGVYVYWIDRDAVAPTPMPSPTPAPAEPYAPALSALNWYVSDSTTRTEDPNGHMIITRDGSGEFGFGLPQSQLSNQYDTVTIFFADSTFSGNISVVEHYATTTIGWQSGEKNSARVQFNGSGTAVINGNPGEYLSALRFYNVPNGTMRISGIVFSNSNSTTPIPTPAPTPEPTPVPAFTQVSSIEDGVYVIAMSGVTPNNGPGAGTSGTYYLTENAYTGSSTILAQDIFDPSATSAEGLSLWRITKLSGTAYTVRNIAVLTEADAYLNINGSANGASMGSVQEISITGGSNFKFMSGERYLRFTNTGGSGFTSGTNTSSSDIKLYKVREDLIPEYNYPTATPVPAYDSTGALSSSAATAWRVSTPIIADGTFDAAWENLPYYNFGNNNTGTTQAMAKIAWDSSYLYVLVRVKDPTFDSSSNNNWERDGGELFLDENNSKETTYDSNTDAFQYRLTGFDNPSNTTNEITAGSNSARTAYAGIVAVPNIIDDGYIMEYKVPWSNPSQIVLGHRIGFELAAFDCTGGSRTQEINFITGGGSLYQNPNLFGAISLSDESGAAPTPSPTPVPTATPEPTDTNLEGNLIDNGNFANGITGWATNYDNGGISAQIVDATHCALVTGRWNAYSGIKVNIPGSYSVGDIINYSFMVKRAEANEENNHFELCFDDGSEHNVTPTSNSDGDRTPYGYTDHWTTMSGSWSVTADTSSLSVVVREGWNGTGRPFYIDDVMFTVISAASISDTTLPADNLITNGNFANGTAGWDTDFYTASISSVIVDGTHCGMITGRANVYTGIRYRVQGSFTAGDVLEYSVKVRRTKPQTNNNYFRVDFNDGTEHNEISANSDGDNRPYCYDDHWTTLTGTWTVTADTSALTVVFKENNWSDVGDDFYVDDFVLRRVTE